MAGMLGVGATRSRLLRSPLPLFTSDDDGRHQRYRRRGPRPGTAQGGGAPLAGAAAAQGEEAVGQRRAALPRLRAGGRLRPLQRGGRRGAGARQGARRHRPQRRRPAGHLRAHRAAVGAGVEALDRRGRGRGGRRLPGPRRRRPLQPLGRRLRREARGPRRAAGRREDRHAGRRRGGRPRRHRQGRGRLRIHRRLMAGLHGRQGQCV